MNPVLKLDMGIIRLLTKGIIKLLFIFFNVLVLYFSIYGS